MPKPAAERRQHHRSVHAIRLSGLCCFWQDALGSFFHGMKPGQPRFALKPLAVQQSAWTPDSSPGRNSLAVLPRQV